MNKVLAFTLLLGITSSATAAEWQTLKSPEGNFEIKMPGKAKTFNRTINTAVGQIKMYFFFVPANEGKVAYMVIYNDYPAQFAANADGKKVVDGAINGAVKQRKGKISLEKEIKLDGHPGKWVIFETQAGGKKMKGHIRTYFVKNRLYQVMLFHEISSAPTQADVVLFFNSFKRLKK